MTKEGHTHAISSEGVPITERKHIGKLLVHVDKQDEIMELLGDFTEEASGS
ncbi:hypothetical protein D3C75_1186250 [compost metagenome]